MRDDLGNRMKAHYENRTRYYLPRRTYMIVRVDGRSFHNYTRGLERPFDFGLMEDMDRAAMALCEDISGSAFAYVQSDEISLLVTDFGATGTESWFDGNLQKIVSISASIATAAFNRARLERTCFALESEAPSNAERLVSKLADLREAQFDSRAFTIPDPTDVENYFIWRQQDATRNSISMAVQAVCSHDALQGKSADEMQEILWQNGVNWNDYPGGCKRGRMVVRASRVETVEYTHKKTGEIERVQVERHYWKAETTPVFTRDRSYLTERIPRY